MSKRYVILAVLLLAFLISSVLTLRFYQLDLIHGVVGNALIQKSPPEQASRIQQTLEGLRSRAEATGKSDAYLQRLLELSQTLEKTQAIDEKELDRLLRKLESESGFP